MARSRLDFLEDIVQEARDAQSFVAGCEWEQFRDDRMRRKAVQCSLSNIAEALRNLDESTRATLTTAGVRLRAISGMRNIIVHEYWRTDPELLWKTATEDMAPLLPVSIESIPPAP